MASSGVTALPPLRVYPEREIELGGWLDRAAAKLASASVAKFPQLFSGRLARILPLARQHERRFATLTEQEFEQAVAQLRADLRTHKPSDAIVGRAFALVREAASRTIGQRHFDVQLVGGFAMIKGMIAEMETGEGKTLTATLPACTVALSGRPVHVVTVNDYLVRRDAEMMGPIYEAVGLTVGVIVHGMSQDQRRAAYRCDVTYCSNKEIAFDYLRDRLILEGKPQEIRLKLERLVNDGARLDRLVMRGLAFAIVDEADSVLIDEARTPLIISSETDPADEQARAENAFLLVEPLEAGEHYHVHWEERLVELTERGRERLEERAAELDLEWMGTVRREEAAYQALTASLLFNKDEHYIVRDDAVQIVDEYTGRIMADRSWSDGLHQLVEVKEGLPATARKIPVARVTYQRFFRRYEQLAGMTGTAKETAAEIWSTYRLPVAKIPTNRPVRRVRLPTTTCRTIEAKWAKVANRVAQLQKEGRPVLVGTRSVGASNEASKCLTDRGIAHVVLNAAQDEHEAEIIAAAGEMGSVTIATNMAGRGVDIKLGPGVEALGGLHVIMSERHDAARIDRQLLGRCGRQGEPGSTEAIVSLEDPLLDQFSSIYLAGLAKLPGALGRAFARLVLDRAQLRAQWLHRRTRADLLRYDQRLDVMFSFSGQNE